MRLRQKKETQEKLCNSPGCAICKTAPCAYAYRGCRRFTHWRALIPDG